MKLEQAIGIRIYQSYQISTLIEKDFALSFRVGITSQQSMDLTIKMMLMAKAN